MAQAILAVRPSQTPPELDQIGPALRVGGLGPLTLSDAWVRRLGQTPGPMPRIARRRLPREAGHNPPTELSQPLHNSL
ncbi:hypothetical protein [Luteithermobacter gelatinilyticus]|uniref:hypothetical protein n=1 Tax=Luteithermobacter gelatinilyticus TaxID=2582913 RepID=UPI001105A1BD|nr:hypothetical protein [Luteithermobacter gelatinilyticus]